MKHEPRVEQLPGTKESQNPKHRGDGLANSGGLAKTVGRDRLAHTVAQEAPLPFGLLLAFGLR